MEERYNRNRLIDGIGIEGQQQIESSRVLVIGAGGLGSPVLYYLAAAGIGTIGIVDDDVVSESNLQRQILHCTADVGHEKTVSAAEKLIALNPDIRIYRYKLRVNAGNAERLILGQLAEDGSVETSNAIAYDFVVDCCDNYATKFLINDVCVRLGVPFSHGAVLAMRGEVMTCIPGTADYRSVFQDAPEDGSLPTSVQIGILGAVAGIVGSIQATEVIKYITGMDGLLTNCLLVIDARTMRFTTLKVRKREV